MPVLGMSVHESSSAEGPFPTHGDLGGRVTRDLLYSCLESPSLNSSPNASSQCHFLLHGCPYDAAKDVILGLMGPNGWTSTLLPPLARPSERYSLRDQTVAMRSRNKRWEFWAREVGRHGPSYGWGLRKHFQKEC